MMVRASELLDGSLESSLMSGVWSLEFYMVLNEFNGILDLNGIMDVILEWQEASK